MKKGTKPGKGDEEKGSNQRRLDCVEGAGGATRQFEVRDVGRGRPAQRVWKCFRKVVQATYHSWQTFSKKTVSGWPIAICASHWRFLGAGQCCVLQLRLQWEWKNIGCSPGSANCLHRASIAVNNFVLWKAAVSDCVCATGEGAPTGRHYFTGKGFFTVGCHIRWKISKATATGWSYPVLPGTSWACRTAALSWGGRKRKLWMERTLDTWTFSLQSFGKGLSEQNSHHQMFCSVSVLSHKK